MTPSKLIKEINAIDGIILKEINFGIGVENRFTIHVLNEKDYLKWDYFVERVNELKCSIKIKKDLPRITFVFPLKQEELENALENFKKALDKKFYLIEKPVQEDLTIIAKITNLCNLDCQYCYDKPFRDKLGHNGIIPLETVDRLIEMASKHAKRITFLWHGGESTLAGVDYFKRFYEEILPKYPYADYIVDLQTNGTLLNEEWFALAKKYKMDIGSSYNATQEDLRRTDDANALGNEENTVYKVLENIHAAQKHDIPAGVIDVMTKENHARIKDIYEYYKKIGIDACFNEIHNAGEAEKHDFLFITKKDQEEYEKITTDYFTHWVNDTSEEFYIERYASEYIQILLTGDSSVCHNGAQCIGRWVGLNSNGDLYPCDRALDNKYRIGNVLEFNNYMEIYNTPSYINYTEERNAKLKKCQNCVIFNYCHGHCPMQDIDEHNTAAIANTYTCQMQKINLMCAYKALLNTDIKRCNWVIRNFLISKCLFLPKEIPDLLKDLGLADKFGDLDFSEKTANFNSKEFKLFAIFNPPRFEDFVISEAMYLSDVPTNDDLQDNRKEILYTNLKQRVENIEKNFETTFS